MSASEKGGFWSKENQQWPSSVRNQRPYGWSLHFGYWWRVVGKIVHRFLAPALSPKAVSTLHTGDATYWRTIFQSIRRARRKGGESLECIPIYVQDRLDSNWKSLLWAWICITSIQSMPLFTTWFALSDENLELNKRVSAMGDWYIAPALGSSKEAEGGLGNMWISWSMQPLQMFKAKGPRTCQLRMQPWRPLVSVDYLSRATDDDGQKSCPEKYRSKATLVVVGAGFITTASLLSWMLFSLVSYPGNQERLLQELVDYGVTENYRVDAWSRKLAFHS